MTCPVRARESRVCRRGAVVACRSAEDVVGDLAPVFGQNPGDFRGLVDVFPGKGVDEHRPGVVPVVGHLPPEQIAGVSHLRAGFVVAPDRDVDLVTDVRGEGPHPVGGDGAQGNFVKTDLAQLGDQGRLGPGQDHEGDPPLFFRVHEPAPVFGIAVVPGVLLFPLVVVTAFAADVALAGHVVGGFTEEKVFAHLLPALAYPGLGDEVGKFPCFPVACQRGCGINIVFCHVHPRFG